MMGSLWAYNGLFQERGAAYSLVCVRRDIDVPRHRLVVRLVCV